MISIEEAWACIDERVRSLETERRAVDEALFHVLAEPVAASVDLPPFDASAMDGIVAYVRDVSEARDDAPVTLPLADEIAAGRRSDWPTLGDGMAARIFTGAPVPPGPVTMIPREVLDFGDGYVTVRAASPVGANIRRRGEELHTGDDILAKGTRLTAGTVAAASMAGVAHVTVRRRPRIAVITTGDEVVAPGGSLAPGQVYDANRAMLLGWARGEQLEVVECRHVADTQESLAAAIGEASERADLVVTTGGVSVGDHDHVLAAAASAGFETAFWKVAQKPGKPLYFGQKHAVSLLGLPGNPGAVFVNIHAFLDRIVDHYEGAARVRPWFELGTFAGQQRSRNRRAQWLRVRVSSGHRCRNTLIPLGAQGSHMLSNLADANAICLIPPRDEPVEDNELLRFFRLPHASRQERLCRS